MVTLTGNGVISNCAVSLDSASRLYGTGSVFDGLTVSDAAGCPWAASSNVSWISFPGAFTGSGPARLSFLISPNAGAQPRTGTITVGTQTLTIVQTGVGLRFIPITPCRVADTRLPSGIFGGPQIPAVSSRDFPISSSACGVPFNAQAYSINVTIVPTGPLHFLTVYPSGQTRPLVSTVNSLNGQIKANAAILPAGTNGAITAYATDATDVIIDINGYFVPAMDPAALSFYPLPPCRVADTRNADGSLGGPTLAALQVRDFPVQSSNCGVPSTAKAYSLNFTVVPKAGKLNYLSTWPAGQAQPLVSTLNDDKGAILANAAIVPTGAGGSISTFVTQRTDLVIDIDGYFAPPQSSAGLSLFNLVPCRSLDTRLNGAPPFNGTIALTQGSCQVPSQAQAYVLNATVQPSSDLHFLTLWPHGTVQPLVSTLNASGLTSNLAIVPTSDGSINAFATDSTHLILDLFAYFAP